MLLGRPRRSALGLVLAVLALLGQAAFGVSAVPLPADQAASDFPICHSSAPDSPDPGTPDGKGRHGMPCALCPVCHGLAAATLLPVPAPPIPEPPSTLLAQPAPTPPARAPPRAILAAIYPTGPPSLA